MPATHSRRRTRAWPSTATELVAVQQELARLAPPPWRPEGDVLLIGGCFACFDAADKGWAAAVLTRNRRPVATALSSAPAGAPYESGLLALREGALLEAAVRSLPRVPDVLLVNATGRDHPRRAGLALHLGAVLGLPTVGVTDRTLLASGSAPSQARGSFAPLCIGDEPVGAWVRTRTGTRPVAAHAAWRTDHDVAVAVVMIATRRARTPEPMRRARRAARTARAGKGFPA